jgi:adenine deaminase
MHRQQRSQGTGKHNGMRISGNIVDLLKSEIYPGTIDVKDGRIAGIERDGKRYGTFIIPGFIDSHVHIESSMLTPSEFARLAVIHGTVATVSDPHEIANVLGMEGVKYMIENGKTVPFKFHFGAPPCVPATVFETSGAVLGPSDIESLFSDHGISYLSEVMNYPGVLNGDRDVMEKIGIARRLGKPIDGHAPGLSGEALKKYVAAGISTDHETFRYEEGKEKLEAGMKLIIREGSAATNFDALSGLIPEYPLQCMFGSDDKHPDDLAGGHINEFVKRGLRMGIDLMTLLRCASLNPVNHYGLDVGLLQVGDRADFLEVDGLDRMDILKTYIDGRLVAENGRSLMGHTSSPRPNSFGTGEKVSSDFALAKRGELVNVIEAIDHQVITGRMASIVGTNGDFAVSDPKKDILKLVVVNRYGNVPPAIGFVKNFGLKKGAMASSVAHDSHNVVAVGATDEDICEAVNLVIGARGGLSIAYDQIRELLPLPIAGLMTDEDGAKVARHYTRLDHHAKQLGSFLNAPFMTLSFMALLVIPQLKLSDKGLFDGEKFEFVDLFA